MKRREGQIWTPKLSQPLACNAAARRSKGQFCRPPQLALRPKRRRLLNVRGEAMAGMLEGKSALVTGGGGGIGRATAQAFAREGARVAVADMMADTAQETVALINRAGGQAMPLTGDITASGVVHAMIGSVVATYGRLDCAFNNAGIAPQHVDAGGLQTAEWSEDSFDRMIAVNLKSVWLCMKYQIPQMQTQGGGAIVNTSSILGLGGLPNGIAYVAAKHGVIGLTKTAALCTPKTTSG
jgi:NAD(P)-dependent dehydrogenase (short-subunit alcohol dehydrogenase family)